MQYKKFPLKENFKSITIFSPIFKLLTFYDFLISGKLRKEM